YNATGEWATQGTVDGRLGEVIHGFSTTGTWKLDGDKLTTTVTDFKTQPKVLKVEGQPDIDLSIFPAHSLLNLEDLIPRESSQEFEVTDLTSLTLKMRGTDIKGREVPYEGARQ